MPAIGGLYGVQQPKDERQGSTFRAIQSHVIEICEAKPKASIPVLKPGCPWFSGPLGDPSQYQGTPRVDATRQRLETCIPLTQTTMDGAVTCKLALDRMKTDETTPQDNSSRLPQCSAPFVWTA